MLHHYQIVIILQEVDDASLDFIPINVRIKEVFPIDNREKSVEWRPQHCLPSLEDAFVPLSTNHGTEYQWCHRLLETLT